MTINLRLAALALTMLVGTVGYAAAQDYRYDDGDRNYRSYDRDDHRYADRDGYRDDNFRRGIQVAREFGSRAGADTARQDMWRGKPFNPDPRGSNHADRGYSRAFGDRYEYREHYSEAYRASYERVYRGYGYYR